MDNSNEVRGDPKKLFKRLKDIKAQKHKSKMNEPGKIDIPIRRYHMPVWYLRCFTIYCLTAKAWGMQL